MSNKSAEQSTKKKKPLPEGVDLVKRAIEVVEAYPGRPKDSKGRPGGLIELPEGKRPIIVGDLHTNLKHLQFIIEDGTNEADLESGKAVCVIVGDAMHDDQTGQMKDMASSIVMLDFLLRFIVEGEGSVIYMRGNHDTFDERLRKSGIAQGLEFKKALLAVRTPEYVEALERFFEALPLCVIGKGFVIVHAGPPRGGITRERLIDIRYRADDLMDLMWKRINEFHGNPSPKEYSEADIRKSIDLLNLPPETHFIVGHNPLWGDGSKTGVWLNVIGIKNHHIIYSGTGSKAPYFTMDKGELVVRYSRKETAEVYYYG